MSPALQYLFDRVKEKPTQGHYIYIYISTYRDRRICLTRVLKAFSIVAQTIDQHSVHHLWQLKFQTRSVLHDIGISNSAVLQKWTQTLQLCRCKLFLYPGLQLIAEILNGYALQTFKQAQPSQKSTGAKFGLAAICDEHLAVRAIIAAPMFFPAPSESSGVSEASKPVVML